MKRFATALLAGAALLAISSESFAAANANAKIAVHLMTTATKLQCSRALVPCQNIVTTRGLYPELSFAYILVTDGNAAEGISGLQFGIQYNGAGATDGAGFDVFSWAKCTDLEFITPTPAWPNSGGGNLMTWVACQVAEPGGAGTGVVAVAGYFYCAAYTPDCLSATPRPVDGAGKVANCAAQEDIVTGTPSHYGRGCFGTAGGYNPCGLITPVENTTWSQIKSSYQH